MKRPIILLALLLASCKTSPVVSQTKDTGAENTELVKRNRGLIEQSNKLKEELECLFRVLFINFKELDTKVRSHVVDHICDITTDNKSAISLLMSALNDEDLWISDRASSALYDVLDRISANDTEAIPEILMVLKLPDKTLQRSALWALSAVGKTDDTPLQILAETLANEDPRLREVALKALGTLGPRAKPGIPRIVNLLEDPDWVVRTSAVITLGEIGKEAKPAIPAIRKAMEVNGWEFKRAATEALRKIGE